MNKCRQNHLIDILFIKKIVTRRMCPDSFKYYYELHLLDYLNYLNSK